MLKRAHRLVNPLDFRRVVRRGRRVTGKYVTMHIASPSAALNKDEAVSATPARIGFVVSKAVGPAVVRNRVKRRLRAIMSHARLASGVELVVRALPTSATATFIDLDAEVARLLEHSR